MRLRFTKMQGLGNDFVMIDGIRQRFDLTAAQARRLADRRHGVGCDQILIVGRPQEPEVDFNYRILNADGGEVEQCGNGARCFGVFVRDQGLTGKSSIRVRTTSSLMTLDVGPDNEVTVDMGVPEFRPPHIPFLAEHQCARYDIAVGGVTVEMGVLALGNPHAVQLVEDVDTAPVEEQGPLIESHPRFPNRVNAGYLQVVDRRRVRLRVYERGVGETLACGSGACAAVVAGRHWGLLDEAVEVVLRGGPLRVAWSGAGQPVSMSGSARKVFEGVVDLETLQ